MPMYHQRWPYPEWLGPIGLIVDEWVTDPSIRQDFQGHLGHWYNEYRRRERPSGIVKCPGGDLIPGGPPNPVALLPSRSMTVPEKYAALCAIHDVACKDAKPLRPWRKERLKDHAFSVGFAYACLKKEATQLTDAQRARVLDVVREVARDLGKPDPVRRQAGWTTIVLQSVNKTVNVSNQRTSVGVNAQRALTGNGNPNATTPKKSRRVRRIASWVVDHVVVTLITGVLLAVLLAWLGLG